MSKGQWIRLWGTDTGPVAPPDFHPHRAEDISGGQFGAGVLYGDIRAFNWNGGSDLTGGADATATLGFFLDASAGAAQFQTLYAQGGTLGSLSVTGTLSLAGSGKLVTATSGARTEITTDQRIAFYDSADALAGQIGWEAGTAALGVNVGGSQVANFFSTGVNVALAGSAAAPSFYLFGDSDTGLFHGGGNILGVTAGGVQVGQFGVTGLRVIDGSAANPPMSFISDANTGLYWISADILGVAAGGAEAGRFGTFGLSLPAGTAAAPSLYLSTDNDTGLYQVAANVLGVAAAGGLVGQFGVTGLRVIDGSAANPPMSFISDANTGLYWISADKFGLTTGGTLRLSVSTSAIEAALPLYLPDGSAAAPAATFTSDPDTGLTWISADKFGAVAGGDEIMRWVEDGAVNGNTVLADDGLGSGLVEVFPKGTLITGDESHADALSYSLTTSMTVVTGSEVEIGVDYDGQTVIVDVTAIFRVEGLAAGEWVQGRLQVNGANGSFATDHNRSEGPATVSTQAAHTHDGTAAGTTGNNDANHTHTAYIGLKLDSAGDSHTHGNQTTGLVSANHGHPFSDAFTTDSKTPAITSTTATDQMAFTTRAVRTVVAGTGATSGKIKLGLSARNAGGSAIVDSVAYSYMIWRG